MRARILSRLLSSLLVILTLSVVTFAILHFLPGDPALAMLGGKAASPEVVANLRAQMGLDDPVYVQYGRFILGALRGDFGRSMRTRAPVTTEIQFTLMPTVQLAIGGLLVSLIIGLPLGILAAMRQGTWMDWLGMSVAVLGVSVPSFWLGLLLITVFAFQLNWFPSGGHSDWRSLVLPSLTLGFTGAAIIARMTRSSLVEVLGEDYVRTARAKGLTERLVILRHAARNAFIPVLTTVGLLIGALLSGAVIIESVFSRPGIGRLLLTAVSGRDFPMVQALVFLISAFYVTINLVVDLLYGMIDPRIRYQ